MYGLKKINEEQKSRLKLSSCLYSLLPWGCSKLLGSPPPPQMFSRIQLNTVCASYAYVLHFSINTLYTLSARGVEATQAEHCSCVRSTPTVLPTARAWDFSGSSPNLGAAMTFLWCGSQDSLQATGAWSA